MSYEQSSTRSQQRGSRVERFFFDSRYTYLRMQMIALASAGGAALYGADKIALSIVMLSIGTHWIRSQGGASAMLKKLLHSKNGKKTSHTASPSSRPDLKRRAAR